MPTKNLIFSPDCPDRFLTLESNSSPLWTITISYLRASSKMMVSMPALSWRTLAALKWTLAIITSMSGGIALFSLLLGRYKMFPWYKMASSKAKRFYRFDSLMMSVLAMGLEKEMSRSVTISSFQQAKLGRSKYANPLFVLFPAPDLLYIVNIVASLLAVLFAFDAVCGESQDGTLKLIMANSVPRHVVLLAKWIGGYLSLALPFIVSLLVSALLISLSSEIPFEGQNWQAFIVTGAVSLLLIAVMFSFGLLVSVRARRSSSAILSLLALWVLLALVLPNAGPFLAEIINPVPDVGEIERKIAESTRTTMVLVFDTRGWSSGWSGMMGLG